MPTNSRALVLPGEKVPFELRDIVVDDAGPGELLVKITSTGICHTDLIVQEGGNAGMPFPIVLGHEGAGVVEQVGEGVKGFEKGDKVLLSFNSCGSCRYCSEKLPGGCSNWIGLNYGLQRPSGKASEGYIAQYFGQSSFAQHTLVYPRCAVKVDPSTDITMLSPLGCGIQTGFGTVYNVLKPGPLDNIGIWGLGGVGMSAVIAASILKAKTVIAIDVVPSRLELAKELGATHVINGRDSDIVEQIRKITGGALLDGAIDTTGVIPCIETAWNALGSRGRLCQLGVTGPGKTPNFDMSLGIAFSKSYMCIMEGDANPEDFVPKLVEFVKSGQLPLDKICKTFPVEQYQEALDRMHDGSVLKPILVF